MTLEEEAETLVSLFLPAEHTYTVTQTPQLTPEVVEELLEHFMDLCMAVILRIGHPLVCVVYMLMIFL